MFDEEKAKKDIEKMRNAYEKAFKKLDEIKARQDKIAKIIYKVREKSNIDN